MAKNASPKKRLFIAKNLIIMLVLAVTIALAVSAWFVQNLSATANGITVTSRAGGIDIAECIKTYDSEDEVLTDGPGVFGTDVQFENIPSLSKDCTGDGFNLIVPEFNFTNDFQSVKQVGKEVNTNLPAVSALAYNMVDAGNGIVSAEQAELKHYIQLEFYVRSKTRELYLSADSALLSKTESDGGSLSDPLDNDDIKKSEYGDFNVDGLVGAIRVSVLAQACDALSQTFTEDGKIDTTNATCRAVQKQLLWLPRPDVFLHVTDGEPINNWSLYTGLTDPSRNHQTEYGKSHQNTYYRPVGSAGVEYVNDSDAKTVVSADPSAGNPVTLGEPKNVTDFRYVNEDTHLEIPVNIIDGVKVTASNSSRLEPYYITKFTVNVWIEGTDAEARRAMDGGEFNLLLSFV